VSQEHALGDANVPVVVEEWADFQCPYCREFSKGPGRQLRDTLVRDGQVRFVFHNFAFLGPESVWAAEAADCAGDQGKFWDYHDKLYDKGNGENQGAFAKPNLERFAAELGLNPQEFDQCLVRGRYDRAVAAEREQGMQLGVESTPTLFVNGRKVNGVPSFAELVQLINRARAAA
jgi:protein-disulfide isomerase